MSLWTTLSIARQGLSIAQIGLQITGQNVANVNTEGYKRQDLIQANMPYGLGATVQEIERVLNPLVEDRFLAATSDTQFSSEVSRAYQQIEEVMNELSNSGLDEEFKDFFLSLQDLSARPSGESERATFRAQGENLGQTFEFYYNQMTEQMKDQDLGIDYSVRQANDLISQIAEINHSITINSSNALGQNELLNDRDEAVRQLAEILPVRAMVDEKDNFVLYIDQGMPLVVGTDYYTLESRPDVTNELKRDVMWVSDTGVSMDVSDQIRRGGEMGAYLDVRDRVLPEQMEKLDRLAAEFVLLFNQQHRAGVGADGVGDRNFFAELPVDVQTGKGTQGGVVVESAVVADVDSLKLSDYEIRFTDDDAYEVWDVTEGVLLESGDYASNSQLYFDGISVVIRDYGVRPEKGDFFKISVVNGAASQIKLSDDLLASDNVIAAGFTGETGDNQNVLLLADMESKSLANGETLSFREVFQLMVVELGVAASTTAQQADTEETLLRQVTTMVESVSGVNIDEESVNLIAYQRGFEAASKVISVVDDMFSALMAIL